MNENGILLTGEVGLDKGEQQHRHHDDQEKYGDFVLEKRTEGGFPVGIIGIAAPLRVLGAEFGKGEGFLVAHFRRDILLKLPGELVAQRVGGLVAQGVKSKTFHQREPSFLAKLIRGSTIPMRMSPKSRPRMEITA